MKFIIFSLILLSFSCHPPVSFDVITIVWDVPVDEHIEGYKVYVGRKSGDYNTVIDVGFDTSYTYIVERGDTVYFSAKYYTDNNTESNFSNELRWPVLEFPKIKFPILVGMVQLENLKLNGYTRKDIGKRRIIKIVSNSEGYVEGIFVGNDGIYKVTGMVYFNVNGDDTFKLFVNNELISVVVTGVGVGWKLVNFGNVEFKRGDKVIIHGKSTANTHAWFDYINVIRQEN